MERRWQDGKRVRHLAVLSALACMLAGIGSAAWGDGDPVQVAKLLAEDGTSADLFGYSVSLSGDLIVVGAYGDGAGSAYVFACDGTQWVQQAKLVADDGALYDFFGNAVAVDGETVVIGAPFDDDFGVQSGSAYVFTRSGDDWVQQAKLVPSDPEDHDWFGCSVAISGDTIVVGAHGDDDNGSNSGSAYVFVCVGEAWTQQAKLLPDDGHGLDIFGWSADVSGDIAVIGSPQDSQGHFKSGSAYVWIRVGETWTQQAKFVSDDVDEADSFAESVALEQNRLVVGTPDDDDNGSSSGSAYVFDLGSACPADVTGDGVVNTEDLLAVLAAWGPCEGCPEDIDADGVVDTADLLFLLGAWGDCP